MTVGGQAGFLSCKEKERDKDRVGERDLGTKQKERDYFNLGHRAPGSKYTHLPMIHNKLSNMSLPRSLFFPLSLHPYPIL